MSKYDERDIANIRFKNKIKNALKTNYGIEVKVENKPKRNEWILDITYSECRFEVFNILIDDSIDNINSGYAKLFPNKDYNFETDLDEIEQSFIGDGLNKIASILPEDTMDEFYKVNEEELNELLSGSAEQRNVHDDHRCLKHMLAYGREGNGKVFGVNCNLYFKHKWDIEEDDGVFVEKEDEVSIIAFFINSKSYIAGVYPDQYNEFIRFKDEGETEFGAIDIDQLCKVMDECYIKLLEDYDFEYLLEDVEYLEGGFGYCIMQHEEIEYENIEMGEVKIDNNKYGGLQIARLNGVPYLRKAVKDDQDPDESIE